MFSWALDGLQYLVKCNNLTLCSFLFSFFQTPLEQPIGVELLLCRGHQTHVQLFVPDMVRLQFGAKAPVPLRKYRACCLGWRSWALSKSSISVIPVEQSTWRCFWLTHRRPLRKLSSLLQFRVCGLQHRFCSQVGRFSNFPYRSSIH